ncbi:MAG: 50S ribosomal protein L2 [Victivallaceae bacterium]|nr:50S ribosomal protein L2 [Victivallaceae bacterium]NLK83905.1 50S ribosomal protein L2 [Lentisphaerota bacterium]MDD3116090.1 50S ribosomal protein L2 [Victivallaceae bacterium]MDD3703079.1 50S ribosomal protein L2 [Victivallaceae bacterium]MDD4317009.1 50S ribosomal protein L2 [Victivallaceae bacterium]
MAMKTFPPITPSLRSMVSLDYSGITTDKPEKSLTKGKSSSGGRNNTGRITTRFRGGGNARRLRQIDFYREKDGIPATVKTIEYDPNRSANIALLFYADGEKRYIIAPVGLKVGDVISSGKSAELKPGNCLKIKDIPVGFAIHNLELIPGQGAKMVRSAGQSAVLRGKDVEYAQVKLPSGEVRRIHMECRATIGSVGNAEKMNVKLGKAGKKRYLGFRPHVRGVVMNPVDHPMGGGEGRSSGGGHPVSPWGKLAKGKKTRSPKKNSSKFIVERRKK